MNTKRQLFRNPNCLLGDDTLSYSACLVGAALYSHRNRLGQCILSLAYLAKCSFYSVPTVCRALGAVRKLRAILVLRCKKHNRIFSSNSYYLKVKKVRRQAAASVPHRGILCSFFCSNSTAVHTQMQSILAHRGSLILYKQPRNLDNVGSYKRRKKYMAEKSAKKIRTFLQEKVGVVRKGTRRSEGREAR